MQRVVAERKGIRAGDKVRIAVKLRSGMDRARVEVFASENGYPFSPYVDPQVAQIREQGKPHFARPFYRNINENSPTHVFELTCEEPDMAVQLVQNCDVAADPAPKVRIKVYGQAATPFRWMVGNFFRRIGRYARSAYARMA